jgi:hypothetical protein
LLYRFSGRGGELPLAGVIFDAAGNLYGTTVLGGDSACVTTAAAVVWSSS